MTKLLNLDSLAKPKRELFLNGKTHYLKEMSVKDFIEISQEAASLDKVADPIAQLKSTVALVKRSVPTLDEAELMEFDFEQLRVVVGFINGEYDAGGEQKN